MIYAIMPGMKSVRKKTDRNAVVEKLYSIGEASKKLDLAAPTLRMYEHHGVLIPYKSKTGRRFYSSADLKRVRCMRHLIKEVGLNLEGIRRLFSLLPCWEIKPCSKQNRATCPVYLDSTKPCWTFQSVVCRRDRIECKSCKIYLMSDNCTDKLKNILRDIQSLRAEA